MMEWKRSWEQWGREEEIHMAKKDLKIYPLAE
jgi:hypothetical protein